MINNFMQTLNDSQLFLFGVFSGVIGFNLICLFGSLLKVVDKRSNYILSYTIKRIIRKVIK